MSWFLSVFSTRECLLTTLMWFEISSGGAPAPEKKFDSSTANGEEGEGGSKVERQDGGKEMKEEHQVSGCCPNVLILRCCHSKIIHKVHNKITLFEQKITFNSKFTSMSHVQTPSDSSELINTC